MDLCNILEALQKSIPQGQNMYMSSGKVHTHERVNQYELFVLVFLFDCFK